MSKMQGADQTAPNSPESIKSKLNTRAAPPMRGLSVRVYRHYGAIDVEFGVTAQFDPENEADQMRLWQMLYQQVNDMHDDWAQNELPNVKPLSKVGQGKTQEQVIEQFNAHEIYKSDVNGKTIYKVRSLPGTKFGKYGVILPREIVEQLDLERVLRDESSIKMSKDYYFSTESNGANHRVTTLEKIQ